MLSPVSFATCWIVNPVSIPQVYILECTPGQGVVREDLRSYIPGRLNPRFRACLAPISHPSTAEINSVTNQSDFGIRGDILFFSVCCFLSNEQQCLQFLAV